MCRIYSSMVHIMNDTTVFSRYGEMMGSNDKRSMNLRRSVSWND